MNNETRWTWITLGGIILMGIALVFSVKHSVHSYMNLQNHYSTGYLAVEMILPIALAVMIFYGIKLLLWVRHG